MDLEPDTGWHRPLMGRGLYTFWEPRENLWRPWPSRRQAVSPCLSSARWPHRGTTTRLLDSNGAAVEGTGQWPESGRVG